MKNNLYLDGGLFLLTLLLVNLHSNNATFKIRTKNTPIIARTESPQRNPKTLISVSHQKNTQRGENLQRNPKSNQHTETRKEEYLLLLHLLGLLVDLFHGGDVVAHGCQAREIRNPIPGRSLREMRCNLWGKQRLESSQRGTRTPQLRPATSALPTQHFNLHLKSDVEECHSHVRFLGRCSCFVNISFVSILLIEYCHPILSQFHTSHLFTFSLAQLFIHKILSLYTCNGILCLNVLS